MSGLILPVLGLGAIAWGVPWLLGRLLPEGVGWLVVNGCVSTLLLICLSGLGFWVMYGAAGDVVWRETPWHFVILSGRSAIIWAPVMVLSLANLPRGWTEVEW
ncbi:hypothetical protein JANAI62_08520 [Jannaschia pagri]|uniref:Uncharacterized protein n=1 Tax=Jannaschia pagri TaxID=2829797 RepID=A0ABQ4NJ46_9RHOB|nr:MULTISPECIES: hypothetical protein [unclassified Jannaschia]GIT89663.1 hypothetical protein JANAI61_01210 [Jannaschia sp. AI_61]GIT94229.1 hypothetical protein JANAI62_08520 [Jannaschia sp. AI_62]